MRDQLFLLKPGFFNSGLGPLYCGDSVAVEGLLSFCPKLREVVDVKYIDFSRPRSPLVEALGEDHQSAPVIILAEGTELQDEGVETKETAGKRFITDERVIRRYLSSQYDGPLAG